MGYYPNGFEQALRDAGLPVRSALKGFASLNDMITFFLNAGNIGRNHETIQYLGWLRSYDPWYEASAVSDGAAAVKELRIAGTPNNNADDSALPNAA